MLTEYKQGQPLDQQRLLIARVSGTLGTIVYHRDTRRHDRIPGCDCAVWHRLVLDWWNDGPQSEKFVLANDLLRITFPYLWFITFTAMAGAILNTLGKFAVAAFTPVFLNIAIIAAAIWLALYGSLSLV